MSWVYAFVNILILPVRGSSLDVRIDIYRRQILTSKDGPRTVRASRPIMCEIIDYWYDTVNEVFPATKLRV